ncbi:Transposase tnp2 [Theobroma cacao]|uniref:Transposase tnp2 n=1 Tax=Theobroma cacao TaxID=3641 RepID=A0A061EDC5_THECC|nr:Transposase tnp2 [Theobroma cacao]
MHRLLSPNRAFLCPDQRLFAALLRVSLTFPKSIFLCRDQKLFATLLGASLTFPKLSLLMPRPEFHPSSALNSPFWTTISRVSVYDNNSSLTVKPRGYHIILSVPRSHLFMVVISQMMDHSGRVFGPLDKSQFLDEDEFYAAELYVLMNCEEMLPYIKIFDEMVKRDVVHISEDELEKVRDARFVKWFKNYAAKHKDEIDPRILEISHGPGKLDNFTVLASDDYEEVNLLIEDEEDDMQRDEDEEDDMEGDDNEDKDEDELEDDDCETFSDDSDNNEEHEFVYSERTMVKEKHSKPRPRSTNASGKQVENETFTHDSRRSLSIDLGASVDDASSKSRDRGPSVGLQTTVDPSDRLCITPIGESYNNKDHQKSLPWSMVDMEESP